jgi:protein TonB
LRRALARQLAFHRYYPPLARSRGWQGEVRLGVRVGSDGRLSRVRVLQTSGHALLDRAAVRSVHAVHGIRHPPQWLKGTHFDIVLQVVYKLLDG